MTFYSIDGGVANCRLGHFTLNYFGQCIFIRMSDYGFSNQFKAIQIDSEFMKRPKQLYRKIPKEEKNSKSLYRNTGRTLCAAPSGFTIFAAALCL